VISQYKATSLNLG